VSEPGPYERSVWSWQRHLAAGGSTSWRDWVAGGDVAAAAPVPAGWSPPGAAQLEVLRRVAVRGELSGAALEVFADLVTRRSGPGRGLAQQPLRWPDADAAETAGPAGRRFGAPPVDPSEVPAEELVRVGTGALTELLLARTTEHSEPRRSPLGRSGRLRRIHRSRGTTPFALAGAPVTTSVVRRALEAAGHAEGARPRLVLLLAEPFDLALAQAWSARVQRGAPVRWHGFVARWSGRRRLPPSMDLPALARRWADRVGADNVHLVVAPAGSDAAIRTAVTLLGADTSRRRHGPGPGGARDLSPAAVDVARRVNAVLGVRAGEERHAAVLGRLVPLLERSGPGPATTGPALTVPLSARDWALGRAAQIADELSAGGYPVHGSPAGVLPRLEGLASHPRREDALEVLLAACARLVRCEDGVEGTVRR
jgi:hypothetical protein